MPFELTIPRRSDKLGPLSKHASGRRASTIHRFSPCAGVRMVASKIASQLFAAVDMDSMKGVVPSHPRRATMDFEGDRVEPRIARRTRNRIADVRIRETRV
jgi:hypothetical protein